tara:strand:+ start:11675 stop:12382 length:708 start_codon:yes stop_codon:yes gene_type:complete
MKISKNIYSQNFIPCNIKNLKKINILSAKKINTKLLESLLGSISPAKNGLMQYPLPLPGYTKVKSIIKDVSLNNNSYFENKEIEQDIQKIKFKKIFELTFYETILLNLFLNYFWDNENLIIPLHKKLTEDQLRIIENTNFNKVYISKKHENFNSSEFHLLSPAGSIDEKINSKIKIDTYTFETSIPPQDYFDKGVFIWETSPSNNGWKMSTFKEEISKVKKIDNFSNFLKSNINL